jgi:uncharacterized repeat protein (TIGR01451 family)
MIRRYAAFAAILALVGLVSWVRGQEQPTPAEGAPRETSRYEGLTEGVANEYGTTQPEAVPEPSDRVQPDSNLPSVLKKPESTNTPRQVQPYRSGSTRPRPIPTAVAPKGAPKRPASGREQATSPRQTTQRPIAPKQATPAPSYGQKVAALGNPPTGKPLQLTIQSPQLQLKAIGPDAITVGKPAKYQIQLSNLGNNDADSIVVRVVLPKTVQIARLEPSAGVAEKIPDDEGALAWTLEQVKGRQAVALTLTLVPQTPESFPISVDWAVRPQSLVAQIAVQKPELKITIDGPDDVLFGARQIFAIRVQNPGTGPARDVRLTLATGDSAPHVKEIGNIEAGQEEVIRVELIAREAGTLDVLANATSEDLKTSARKEVLVRRADLIVKVAGPPVKYANTDGVYQVTISNMGNAAAEEVVTRVQLPVGCQLLAASDGGREKAGRVEWSLPKLEPNQRVTFNVRCLFEAAGDQRVAASVESGVLVADDTFATRVESIADLKMVVHDPRGPRPVGEEVSYIIEITNRGTKSALNVNVAGHFSKGLEVVRFEGHQAESGNGTVNFSPIRRIDPGKTVKLTIHAKAEKPGNLSFKSTVVCADPDTKLSAEDSTRYFGADLGAVRVSEDSSSESRYSRE